MRLTDYEKKVQRDIESWRQGEAGLVQQVFNWAMKPVDWVVEQVVPENVVDQASDAVAGFLATLNDASEWTFDESSVVKKAQDRGLSVEAIADLRDKPIEDLDALAKTYFTENAVLAAVEGGGTGLGGAALLIADIPLLFTINFRLIQQIGASYGFSLRTPEFRPLLLAIFNVAASSSKDAKHNAMREMSVAAAAFAHDIEYRGRRSSDTFREQNRHLPREIAKNLIGQKLGQMIPIAGAAIGAGVNYWFTTETAEAAFMLFRALYVERKERL
ncbi:MAG: EcsC family protein [Bacteroidota bacterium]